MENNNGRREWAYELAVKAVLALERANLIEANQETREKCRNEVAEVLRYYGISDIGQQQIAKARLETMAAESRIAKLTHELAKLTYVEPPF